MNPNQKKLYENEGLKRSVRGQVLLCLNVIYCIITLMYNDVNT